MEILENTICKLCLCKTTDENRTEIAKEITSEVLAVVIPSLDQNDKDQRAICSPCTVKLFAALNFKGTCLNTEDCIFPYIDSEKLPLDLKMIYSKEKGTGI